MTHNQLQITWTDLATDTLRVEDGTQVEISGYLHPVDPDGPHDYFVFAPDEPCCYGCLPRDRLQAIEVFAAKPVSEAAGLLRLTGTLRCLTNDPGGWRYQILQGRTVSAEPSKSIFSRRSVLAAGSLACLATTVRRAVAQAPVASDDVAGRQAIADRVTVDLHSHAGGLAGVRRVDRDMPFTPVGAPMRIGGMAVACLAVVSDAPTHRIGPDRRIHPFRDPEPGELYAFGNKAFARVHALASEQRLGIVTTTKELHSARSSAPCAIIAAEGADFLEGQVARVDEAYTRWQLRHLQLTHYRPNELGDIQTEAPVHGGLTAVGADVIRRCNSLGIVVDVAHGTFDLVKHAATVTRKPLILSHTSLSEHPTRRSRLISPDHARVIAATGGVIGIWPPAHRFPTLARLAEGIAAMVDVVGIDHVGLGTDMLGLTGPSIFPTYASTSPLSAALLEHGFNVDEVRKLLGGNYVRVFEQTLT